ncbi:MAG TPA: class I SAM-dependent methyltransferase [Chitinophagaceae bacterium]|nr:class I SAM-dependent methyltransferase [Chitinophagaceae bacterium]
MNCRFCKIPLEHVFIDLNNSPASNSFLTKEQLNEPEVFYPLKVYTCTNCFLVQIDEYKKSGAIFNSDYVYFSSYSTGWLKHSKSYVEKMIERFGYNPSSIVSEIASNDGYLLQYFKEQNIPVLGIEPTGNTAEVARNKGIETIVDFFSVRLAKEIVTGGRKADLLLGNNVLAHVPDIIDFVKGMKIFLKDTGVITMEFPHLLQLINNSQFDTIYHEHFSYLSFYTVKKIFESVGLKLFDVEEIPTHGGSLRIYATHDGNSLHEVNLNVQSLLDKEISFGINKIAYYEGFQQKALRSKIGLLEFLISQKNKKKKVIAYGAAAKGNTLLNYCGIKNDLVDFVVDANPHKQNKFLPGSHIPVFDEKEIKQVNPDYVLILPWNLKSEITSQLSYIKDWGGKFVIPIPEIEII